MQVYYPIMQILFCMYFPLFLLSVFCYGNYSIVAMVTGIAEASHPSATTATTTAVAVPPDFEAADDTNTAKC